MSPPPTPNSPAAKPAIAPISKYMINSMIIFHFSQIHMDLETRQLQQLLAEAQQLPEVLLLKPVTTSTNDDVREIAQKGFRAFWSAVHDKLKVVDSVNDNGFLLKETSI